MSRVMPLSRFFDFEASRLGEPCAELFMQSVDSICGVTSKATRGQGLLSSLPSELVFNDLRDSRRRHSKKEKCDPCNLHSVSSKSVSKRSSTCTSLDVSDEDWCKPLPRGMQAIKKSVHSVLRTPNKGLGVSTEGLTRHKNCATFTKPHILAQRLELFQLLCREWHRCEGDDVEDKSDVMHSLVKSLWLSKLIEPHTFLRVSDVAGTHEDMRLLVLCSGPNCARTLMLSRVPDSDFFHIHFASMSTGLVKVLFKNMYSVEDGFGKNDGIFD